MLKLVKYTSLLLLATACLPISHARDLSSLEKCHVDGLKEKVLCGTLEVAEDPQQPDGAKVPLNIVVLPAVQKSPQPDPLLFLAGGPGQAATELANLVNHTFKSVRNQRDIVLVDQRGTGKSNPLQCEQDEQVLNDFSLNDETYDMIADVKQCLAGFDDYQLQHYTSEAAIDDLEAVRRHLDYPQVNIYGGSYGTRAGLLYMRMYPESIRSVILDSVAPPQVVVGPFGVFGHRAFELMLQDCQQQASCAEAFPNLGQQYQDLVSKLVQQPQTFSVRDPKTFERKDFLLTASKLGNTIRTAMYSTTSRRILPLMIDKAAKGDLAPLAGLASILSGQGGMYIGLTFNILCSEDMPRASEELLAKDAANPFISDRQTRIFKQACSVWPRYKVEASFADPVVSDIPTFILSGHLDPVTPPEWGDLAAETLANARHFVVKNGAHTPIATSCANKLAAEFIESLDLKAIDDSCLQDESKPLFMTNVNGTGINKTTDATQGQEDATE